MGTFVAMRFLLDTDSNGFTDDDEHTVITVSTVASVLSMCGSAFIVICILYFKKWELFHFRLVFMLSVADLINSFSFFLQSPKDPSGTCTFQSILQQFGGTYSYCWVVAIAFTIYRMMVEPESQDPDQAADDEEEIE